MLKENYYYLVAGLPELFLDENIQVESSLAFLEETKTLVSDSDFEMLELLYLAKDNRHILNLFFETGETVNSATHHIVSPLEYTINFLEWADDKKPKAMKLEFENKLHSLYYSYVLSSTQNSFLKEWFTLELNIKNILTSFNCKTHHHSFSKHLIKTKHYNPVYSLLKNKQLKHELFEDDVPMAKQIFAIAQSDANSETKEKEIDQILWDYLDEQTCYDYFSIEKLLVHIIKLNIVERWSKLNEQEGKTFLNKLIEDIKLSYVFSDKV